MSLGGLMVAVHGRLGWYDVLGYSGSWIRRGFNLWYGLVECRQMVLVRLRRVWLSRQMTNWYQYSEGISRVSTAFNLRTLTRLRSSETRGLSNCSVLSCNTTISFSPQDFIRIATCMSLWSSTAMSR